MIVEFLCLLTLWIPSQVSNNLKTCCELKNLTRARCPVVLKARVVSRVFGQSSVFELDRVSVRIALASVQKGARQRLLASRYHPPLANFLIVMHAITMTSSG